MAVFMILALISSEYGQKELSAKEEKKMASIPVIARNISLGLCIALLLINLGQLAAINTVNKAANSGSSEKFMDALKVGAMLDFTNDMSYKTSYITAYSTDLPKSYFEQSQNYAEDLKAHNSFETLTQLVNYYLKIGANEEAYKTLNNRLALMRYDATAWNDTFDFYRVNMENFKSINNEKEVNLILKYAGAAYDQLAAYSAESPLDIILNEENEQFREIVGE